ncbi:MAG: hypothetical protein NVV68_00350 [Dokdonella sp.]|nr:hypothetical protein [Dokdonella sp.]
MITRDEAARMLFEHLRWIDVATDQMPVPGDDRHRLGLAATDLLHEHARSVLFLLTATPGGQSMVGSALALLRPMFEALVRSWLILYSSSEQELKRHLSGDALAGHMRDWVARVERVGGLNHDGFMSIVLDRDRGLWHMLNGFTHGGAEQLVRRIGPENIGPQYSEDDVVLALLFAAELSLISSVVALEIGNRDDAARVGQERLRQMAERLNQDGAAIRITDEVGRMTPPPQDTDQPD